MKKPRRKIPTEKPRGPFHAAEKPSARLDAFLQQPHDISVEDFLDMIPDDTTREVMYWVHSGLGNIPPRPDDDRPDWAKNALKEMVRSSGMESKKKAPSEADTMGDLVGQILGIPVNRLNPSNPGIPLLEAFRKQLPEWRTKAAQLPPAEAAAFFNAQKDGERRTAQLAQVSQRTKIFGTIAFRWREVSQLKSAGELTQWLRAIENDGKRLIAPSTDSREIRTVCKIIGLRYHQRGGRPRKKTRL